MQRRLFVKLSAFTAAAIAIPLSHGCSSHVNDAESQPIFFSHLADIQAIKDAGRNYLVRYPKERNIETLKKLLLADLTAGEAPDNIARRLFARTGEDFKHNRIVVANGWFLSQTEARQCALYYLLSS